MAEKDGRGAAADLSVWCHFPSPVSSTTPETVNPVHDEEALYRRLRAALEANWDAALEVGCMEHGGFDWLTEAAYRACRDLATDVDSVYAATMRRDLSSEAPA